MISAITLLVVTRVSTTRLPLKPSKTSSTRAWSRSFEERSEKKKPVSTKITAAARGARTHGRSPQCSIRAT
jgi:hypothetical protein